VPLANCQGPRIVLIVAAIALLMDVSSVYAYDPANFEGDGAIVDRGFWSYKPRYRIELQPHVSLAASDRRQFRFRGVPTDPLSIFLVIQDNSHYEYEQLRRISTVVDLTLTDATGREVCRAVGPLSDWKLMWSRGRDGAYWQHQCTELRLRSTESYVLVVAVSRIDLVSPPLRISALLSGGGWDSP